MYFLSLILEAGTSQPVPELSSQKACFRCYGAPLYVRIGLLVKPLT